MLTPKGAPTSEGRLQSRGKPLGLWAWAQQGPRHPLTGALSPAFESRPGSRAKQSSYLFELLVEDFSNLV